MESVLENQRRLHEERERLVDAIVHEFLHENKSNHRSVVNTQHRVKELVDRYHGDTSKLAELYEDADQSRQKELDAVAGPNEFAEFYSRLKALKDVHRRNPDEVAVPLSMEFQQMKEEVADPDRVEKETIPFTDEEGYGRYLDMHSLFANYLNLKGVRNIVTSKKGAQKESHIDYVTYVAIFDRFEDIPRDLAKKTGSYKEYLNDLKAYLVSFFERTRPLFDLKELFQRAADEVEANWETGKVPGWEKDPQSALNAAVALDLSPFANAQELEQLGGDRLKSALLALGLKCGGTVKERAERLFATKGHKLSDLELSVLAKKNDTEEREKRRQKELAVLESEIRGMAVALREERDATKENIERKQARAVGEEDEEEEAEQIVEYEEEERDDSIPYNPKNLPLGWDGKPIPYWLYKLHGLNLSYECEICGNQVYKGPKAFQRHFTEWRHSHGMRCLGIPNTAHFANITKIADATELWQKMRLEKETSRWNPEVHEEFEDSAGNVVNKRTFEDLQRQGLL